MKKALIVDDIPEYIDTIEVYIEDCFEVLKAENFEEAMKILAKTSVDLAIIDIRLREDDPENKEGLELVRWIKEKKKEEEGRGHLSRFLSSEKTVSLQDDFSKDKLLQ